MVGPIPGTERYKVKLGEEFVRIDSWIVGLIRKSSQNNGLSQVRQQFHEVISATVSELFPCGDLEPEEGARA